MNQKKSPRRSLEPPEESYRKVTTRLPRAVPTPAPPQSLSAAYFRSPAGLASRHGGPGSRKLRSHIFGAGEVLIVGEHQARAHLGTALSHEVFVLDEFTVFCEVGKPPAAGLPHTVEHEASVFLEIRVSRS